MTIHAPAVHPRHMPSVAGLGPFLLAIVFLAMLAALLFWAVPRTTTPTQTGVWMTEQRHGEIDAGRTGPHSDYLQFRAGEINAGKEMILPAVVPIQYRATTLTQYPGGFTANYNPVAPTTPTWEMQYPGGFTSTYNPLQRMAP